MLSIRCVVYYCTVLTGCISVALTDARLNSTAEWTESANNSTGEWTEPANNSTGEWTEPANNSTGEWTEPANNSTGEWTEPANNSTQERTEPANNRTGSGQEIMLVTPDPALCVNKTEPCQTLAEYNRAGALSLSDVKWKFLASPSPHILTPGVYLFDRVTNVALACETEEEGACVIHCNADQKLCTFLFLGVQNLTLSSILINYRKVPNPHSGQGLNDNQRNELYRCIPHEGNNCSTFLRDCTVNYGAQTCPLQTVLAERSWVFIDCTNVVMTKMTFLSTRNMWTVIRPRGYFILNKSSFTKIASKWKKGQIKTIMCTGYHHIRILIEPPSQSTNCPLVNGSYNWPKLTFSILNSRFAGNRYLPEKRSNGSNYPAVSIHSNQTLHGWQANVTIENTEFEGCAMVEITAVEDLGMNVAIKDCTVDGMITSKVAKKWSRRGVTLFSASAVQITTTNYQWNGKNRTCSMNDGRDDAAAIVTISGCNFTNLTSHEGTALLLKTHTDIACPMANLLVERNTFKWIQGIFRKSIVLAQNYPTGSIRGNTTRTGQRIIFRFNSFKDNFKSDRRERCLIYKNFAIKNNYWIIKRNRVHFHDTYKQICYWHGVMYFIQYSYLTHILLENNVIADNIESGIHLVDSTIQFRGKNTIDNCRTSYGGAIKITGNSQLLFESNSSLEMTKNKAFMRAGGVLVQDYCTFHQLAPGRCPCFFGLVSSRGQLVRNLTVESVRAFNASVRLSGNVAGNEQTRSASMLFNTNIDQCHLNTVPRVTRTTLTNATQRSANLKIFQHIFHLDENHTYNSTEISSIPRRMCFCKDSRHATQTCNLNQAPPIRYYQGQRIQLYISLEGDMSISLSNVLQIYLVKKMKATQEAVKQSKFARDSLHWTDYIKDKCNFIILPPIPYIGPSYYYHLQLRVPLLADTTIQEENASYLIYFIRTIVKPGCPRGFVRNKAHSCVCHPELVKAGYSCSLDDLTVSSPLNTTAWIGPDSRDASSLLWSTSCPHMHCRSIYGRGISLEDFSKQCKNGREGKLCGQCSKGLSAVIDSPSKCQNCSDSSVVSIVLILAAAPIGIILLGILNLTISVGTINGYMFYITVFGINSDILNSFNLGIACLFNGLNEFAKYLIGYLFSLYLLALVVTACCLPKCSACISRSIMHKVNRKIGRRITPILATVVTMAYLIITGVVIATFQNATIYSTDGTKTLVWLYDGNLAFFASVQHAILGCFAIIMLIIVVVPSALIATAGDLLRRYIKGPFYMNFLDTFHGAFRFRFGFWFGMKLFILNLLMIIKVVARPKVVQYAIVLISSGILIFQHIFKPFKGMRIRNCISLKMKAKHSIGPRTAQNFTNTLDNTFHANLMILFASILYSQDVQAIASAISLAVANLELVLIIVYHMMEFTRLGKYIAKLYQKTKWRYKKRQYEKMKRRIDRNDSLKQLTYCRENNIEIRLDDCWTESNVSDESEIEQDTALNEHSETKTCTGIVTHTKLVNCIDAHDNLPESHSQHSTTSNHLLQDPLLRAAN